MTAALTTSLRGAGVQQGAAEMAADQRQHDHPVEGDQQAARRRIVDRRDAAFRRGGPQPGAEQEVEGAPVEQRLEDLLAEQAADALGIADAGQRRRGRRWPARPGRPCRAAGPRPKARSGDWPTRRSKVADAARGSAAGARHTRPPGPRPRCPAAAGSCGRRRCRAGCIRCRPSAGIWWTVNSSALGQHLEEDRRCRRHRPTGPRPSRPIRRRSRRPSPRYQILTVSSACPQ